MQPAPVISNTNLETELHFECIWFEDSWEELESLARRGTEAVKEDPLRHNLTAWSCVDRMLIHATRIQRLLNPGTEKDSRESNESWDERVKFAREMAQRINPDLMRSRELRLARNIVEHSNAYFTTMPDPTPPRRLHPFQFSGARNL